MKKIGLWTLGLLVILSLSACGSSKTAPQPALSSTSTTTDAPTAEALFKQSCVSCHGVNLEGKMGPRLQKVGAELSKDQILKKIQNGGGGMPAFQKRLKTNEIEILAEWLSLKK